MDEREQILAEGLKAGKEKSLKEFYKEYFPLFVSFAGSLLESEEECKDVVHDVFLKYWTGHREFDNLISIRAFFYKSIRNACLNALRHKLVHDKFLRENLRCLQDDDFLLETIIRKEIFHIVHREIACLTVMEQKVLPLSLEKKTNEEIAAELGIAVSTVKSHKAKSYAELRRKLDYLKLLYGLLLIS